MWCLSACSFFGNCLSKYWACGCFMAFALSIVLIFWLILHLLPTMSFAGFTSWFCGTCAVAPACPPCQPQFNLSPHCECHENLNNCKCDCVSYADLTKHQQRWASDMVLDQRSAQLSQMDVLQFKRRVLLILLGLSVVIMFLLVALICVTLCGKSCRLRYLAWRHRTRLQRRERLMRKHNLIEGPTSSSIIPSLSLSSAPRSSPLPDTTAAPGSPVPLLSPVSSVSPSAHFDSSLAASFRIS